MLLLHHNWADSFGGVGEVVIVVEEAVAGTNCIAIYSTATCRAVSGPDANAGLAYSGSSTWRVGHRVAVFIDAYI